MKRFALTLFVGLCVARQGHSQDLAQQGIPTALIRTFEKAEAELRRNREAYEKANEKALAEFNKAVKKDVDRLSKAGKPEEALALKDAAEAWFQQTLKGAAPDALPPIPRAAEDKKMNPNGRIRLVDIKPATTEGAVVIEEAHEGVRPIINGQVTTEPFVFTRAPSQIAWQVPEGKKVFRSFVYYLGTRDANGGHTAIMQVRADGQPIARSAVISVNSRLSAVETRIPAGTKFIMLVADPNGDDVYDNCIWVNPSFYDR